MKNRHSPLVERHSAVVPAPSLALGNLEQDLLADAQCESGFSNVGALVPPKFDTRFVIRSKGGKIVLCALIPFHEKASPGIKHPWTGSMEVVFDFRNDEFGYTQFVFAEGKEVGIREFAPYPESKSTASTPVRPTSFRFVHRTNRNSSLFALRKILFYAEFREADLFRFGDVIGFNLCRNDAASGGMSSWSLLAGNGALDATSLGRLHRSPSQNVRKQSAPQFSPVKNFRVSVTNDTPMVVVNRGYTLKSLDAEMAGLSSLGIRRLHWIDYSNFPAFWALPLWDKNARDTQKNCGDLLPAACTAARRHGIELVPDFKIFDLSFPSRVGTPKQRDKIAREGTSDLLCIPEMLNAKDAFMQTNPAWRRELALPIRTLRIFSLEPFSADAVLSLSQSKDNLTYTPVKLRKGMAAPRKVRRPNLRWSPDGMKAEPGTHESWVLEIDDLRIKAPLLKVEIQGGNTIRNRHFALIEAIGADGGTVPFICSDHMPKKNTGEVFDFFGAWPGWNNTNDHAYNFTTIDSKSFGITWVEPPALPGVLEPTHPKAQEIWLGRIDHYLEHDVAGISIRTLCHHRRCQSWLQYAFAPSAIAAFESEQGRSPEANERDFALMRRVRGSALGDFLSEAASRIRAKKKKSIFQVETGGELPPEHESRMALYYDYEHWISSGLFDELHVRSITAHSPWLRRVILPLARKHGVEVHLLTRNQANGHGPQDFLNIRKSASDAHALGYHGINFYESANLYELTDADTFLPRAMGSICIREAIAVTR